MYKIYAELIIKGLKTIDDVPDKLKEAVKKELIKRGREDIVEEKEGV